MTIAVILVSVVLGAVIGWLVALVAANSRAQGLSRDLAAAESKLAAEQSIAKERERALAVTIDAALEKMKNVAVQSLGEQEKSLAAKNGEQVRGLLEPLRQQMDAFRKAAEESKQATNAVGLNIKNHFDALKATADVFDREAKSFVEALKSGNKKQGVWGEEVLAETLRRSGLVEGEHFVTQTGTGTGDIPDVVIFDASSQKSLVVDAKTSLKDYLEAYNAADPAQRAAALKAHVASMKKHVQELADKKYAEKDNALRPGYTYVPLVAMFVPCDAMLETAISEDPQLMQYAYERGVVLVTPLTLLGYLWLVSRGWSRYTLDRNAEKIQTQAKLLIERVDLLFKHFENIGDHLDKAREEHEDVMKLIVKDGSGRSIKGPAQEIIRLGGKTDKKIKSAALTGEE